MIERALQLLDQSHAGSEPPSVFRDVEDHLLQQVPLQLGPAYAQSPRFAAVWLWAAQVMAETFVSACKSCKTPSANLT